LLKAIHDVNLVPQRVEKVNLNTFASLQSGDVLFIDSSHVSKAGSDVNFLFFEVLPRVPSAVRIHIHDIFLPGEYPKRWVIEENRSWNEQYVLRALLMYSNAFRVLFGSAYALLKFKDLVSHGGGSLWIERL
jgi:hypothetical protein